MVKYLSSLTINVLLRNKNCNRLQGPCTFLIFIANFIKGKFGFKTRELKDNVVKDEPFKIIEIKDLIIKEVKE